MDIAGISTQPIFLIMGGWNSYYMVQAARENAQKLQNLLYHISLRNEPFSCSVMSPVAWSSSYIRYPLLGWLKITHFQTNKPAAFWVKIQGADGTIKILKNIVNLWSDPLFVPKWHINSCREVNFSKKKMLCWATLIHCVHAIPCHSQKK